jgi:large subunit ribosomal protein L24
MTLARIRRGDEVVVLAGKEKGKKGVVRQVLPKEDKAIVQDLNIAKRHFKPGRAQQAGVVDLEQPIHLSNLAPLDPKTGKPTRVRTHVLPNGDKVRLAASGEQIGNK